MSDCTGCTRHAPRPDCPVHWTNLSAAKRLRASDVARIFGLRVEDIGPLVPVGRDMEMRT